MDLIQFSMLIISFTGLFIWNRTENRADMRHMDAKLESTRELVRTIHDDSKEFRYAMLQESKDFHGRLCEIEAQRKK